jgi:hypothetical protein
MQPSHTLKIETLGDHWSDKDTMILHACFQMLTDCLKNEKLYDHWGWSDLPESEAALVEIKFLESWWGSRIEKEKDPDFDSIWLKEQYQEDNEMLIRLIKVRHFLWT